MSLVRKLFALVLVSSSVVAGCASEQAPGDEVGVGTDESSEELKAKKNPCAVVRCAAGFHCEVKKKQASCVADEPCPGLGSRNAAGQCECNALAKCAAGYFFNSDPAVCSCASQCQTVRCGFGTHCEIVDGSAACVGDSGACASDADCQVVDNYCDGCSCDAQAAGAPAPVCGGTIVNCFAQPCMNKVARCDAGVCVVAAAPAGEPCGSAVCGEGLVCCNASCGICTPPGGFCTQQACSAE